MPAYEILSVIYSRFICQNVGWKHRSVAHWRWQQRSTSWQMKKLLQRWICCLNRNFSLCLLQSWTYFSRVTCGKLTAMRVQNLKIQSININQFHFSNYRHTNDTNGFKLQIHDYKLTELMQSQVIVVKWNILSLKIHILLWFPSSWKNKPLWKTSKKCN